MADEVLQGIGKKFGSVSKAITNLNLEIKDGAFVYSSWSYWSR